MVWLASTWVSVLTSRMMSDSSRIVVMNVSRNPATNPLLVSGRIRRRNRRQALAPATCPASSSSRPTCIMADTPEAFAKQMREELAVYKDVVAKQKLTLD